MGVGPGVWGGGGGGGGLNSGLEKGRSEYMGIFKGSEKEAGSLMPESSVHHDIGRGSRKLDNRKFRFLGI